MQTPNANPHLLINTAIEALKHAYEGCPASPKDAKIIIAIKAIIQLQHELENIAKQCRHNATGDHIHRSCDCCAAS